MALITDGRCFKVFNGFLYRIYGNNKYTQLQYKDNNEVVVELR